MKFGLIGKDVRNSFSKIIHESLGYSYDLVSLNEDELQEFFEKKSVIIEKRCNIGLLSKNDFSNNKFSSFFCEDC